MGWRVVFVANPAKLGAKNAQLVVANEDGLVSVPMEDVSALVIETRAASLSSHLMSELGRLGVAVFFCDEKHMPCASLVPFCQHSRSLAALKMQLSASEPLRKNCWKRIIHRKISNQARCLDMLEYDNAWELEALAGEVRSGDATNREAVASRAYFSRVLRFSRRGDDDATNASLNYGYAILRGAIARSVASHGLLPSIGIHHKNELNPFNLADDFIEPFRPIVDLWVLQNLGDAPFDQTTREGLVKLLVCFVLVDEEKVTVLRAIEMLVSSFVSVCREKKPELLKLPCLIPISPRLAE